MHIKLTSSYRHYIMSNNIIPVHIIIRMQAQCSSGMLEIRNYNNLLQQLICILN